MQVRRPGNPFREDQYVKGVEDLLKFEDAMGQIGRQRALAVLTYSVWWRWHRGLRWWELLNGTARRPGGPPCRVHRCPRAAGWWGAWRPEGRPDPARPCARAG